MSGAGLKRFMAIEIKTAPPIMAIGKSFFEWRVKKWLLKKCVFKRDPILR